MGHESSNRDLRNTGDGGSFYAENELFSIFAPLIGPKGLAAYGGLASLISSKLPITPASLAAHCCLDFRSADRKLREMIALGMVVQHEGSAGANCTYELVNLNALAIVGTERLRKRLEEARSIRIGGPR